MDTLFIKTTPAFDRVAKKLFTTDVLEELYDYLSEHPEKGDIIAGTGGVRKLRWKTGRNNKGKSGGVRVLYHYSKDILIILITAYSKTDKENITQAERNELKQLMPNLIEKYKSEL
ncbi:MAG: hypothetical protein A3F10_05825 [Coxiella sp. RIFCSPHIGHO2_12_FULL_42_15]|nr:MAG: hypothetical protein A3F10_05825 [Coxiella sp. RIFCSPHIGHO2_12_FULL_42_15]